MKVVNLEQTGGACPTIFEWVNGKGEPYYFRLRHGYARIQHDTEDTVKIEGDMPGFDGVCSFEDVKKWAKKRGLKLKVWQK